jgi:hypothetical protein
MKCVLCYNKIIVPIPLSILGYLLYSSLCYFILLLRRLNFILLLRRLTNIFIRCILWYSTKCQGMYVVSVNIIFSFSCCYCNKISCIITILSHSDFAFLYFVITLFSSKAYAFFFYLLTFRFHFMFFIIL